MKRQAATPKGFLRRLQDLQLGDIRDPRQAGKVQHPLPAVLGALVLAFVTRSRSLRSVEQRTAQLRPDARAELGLDRRIADNTFCGVLPAVSLDGLMAGLHRLVLAEHRRGNLQPTRQSAGTVAIDGKNVATLHWPDLCRLVDLDPDAATTAQVRERFVPRFLDAQFCEPQAGQPYALVRVHTATLISAAAAVCLHQRPILGATNEIGSLPGMLRELHAAYAHSRLFRLITTDAGNTSRGTADLTVQLDLDYFSQLKSEHGDLYAEAVNRLAARPRSRACKTASDAQHGNVVTYRLWRYDLTDAGWLDWTHARQLPRVERLVERPNGTLVSVGNRYYVTSRSTDQLGPNHALDLSRGHWRCEEETHWTADAELLEDRRRLAWSRHPRGVLVVSALRMMALCILAVARQLSRVGASEETPSWEMVREHFLLVLCRSTLVTAAFDQV